MRFFYQNPGVGTEFEFEASNCKLDLDFDTKDCDELSFDATKTPILKGSKIRVISDDENDLLFIGYVMASSSSNSQPSESFECVSATKMLSKRKVPLITYASGIPISVVLSSDPPTQSAGDGQYVMGLLWLLRSMFPPDIGSYESNGVGTFEGWDYITSGLDIYLDGIKLSEVPLASLPSSTYSFSRSQGNLYIRGDGPGDKYGIIAADGFTDLPIYLGTVSSDKTLDNSLSMGDNTVEDIIHDLIKEMLLYPSFRHTKDRIYLDVLLEPAYVGSETSPQTTIEPDDIDITKLEPAKNLPISTLIGKGANGDRADGVRYFASNEKYKFGPSTLDTPTSVGLKLSSSYQDYIFLNRVYLEGDDITIGIDFEHVSNSDYLYHWILSYGWEANPYTFFHILFYHDKLYMIYGHNGHSEEYVYLQFSGTPKTFVSGTTYNLVITLDKSAGEIQPYVDGVAADTWSPTNGLGTFENERLYLGHRYSITGDSYYPPNILIHTVRAWNKVLSGDEITSLSSGNNVADSQKLFLKFDEGEGNYVHDRANFSLKGELVGFEDTTEGYGNNNSSGWVVTYPEEYEYLANAPAWIEDVHEQSNSFLSPFGSLDQITEYMLGDYSQLHPISCKVAADLVKPGYWCKIKGNDDKNIGTYLCRHVTKKSGERDVILFGSKDASLKSAYMEQEESEAIENYRDMPIGEESSTGQLAATNWTETEDWDIGASCAHNGQFFLCDKANNLIQVYDIDYINNKVTFSHVIITSYSDAWDMCVDDDHIYLLVGETIYKITHIGIYVTSFSASLTNAYRMTQDNSGYLYVAGSYYSDYFNWPRIQKISKSSGSVSATYSDSSNQGAFWGITFDGSYIYAGKDRLFGPPNKQIIRFTTSLGSPSDLTVDAYESYGVARITACGGYLFWGYDSYVKRVATSGWPSVTPSIDTLDNGGEVFLASEGTNLVLNTSEGDGVDGDIRVFDTSFNNLSWGHIKTFSGLFLASPLELEFTPDDFEGEDALILLSITTFSSSVESPDAKCDIYVFVNGSGPIICRNLPWGTGSLVDLDISDYCRLDGDVELIQVYAKVDYDGIYARWVSALIGDNNDFTLTAVEAGSDGCNISFDLEHPGNYNPTIDVVVTGNDIVVYLETEELFEEIVSTAAEVVDAINNSGPASALVTAALKTGSNGEGVVTSYPKIYLSQGLLETLDYGISVRGITKP